MSEYAQTPSGIILPEAMARSIMTDMLFGNSGAYRSASGNNKNTIGWLTTDGSADADTLTDLQTLRQQSRDLVRNEAIPAGAISSVVTAVVFTGITPQSVVDAEYLGISEEQAMQYQAEAERLFTHWADSKNCDATRRLNFWQMQELALRSKLENGDALAVRRFVERAGAMFGTSLQLVEADRVYTPPDKGTSTNVRAGIELGDFGEPVACYVADKHPGEVLAAGGNANTKFARVPFFDDKGDPLVLFMASIKRIDQTRGVPFLAPVIEPLKQLGRYTEAEITAAVISGMFAVFVKSPAAGTGASPINALGVGVPGMVGGGSAPQVQKPLTKLQSGMMMDLAPGEEITVAEAGRPNTAFDPFVRSIMQQIGVGLEIPYEVLTKAYTASYSAARAAIMEAWRMFQKEREALIAEFCVPAWRMVITEAVARGYLQAPSFWDSPLKRDAWLAATWIGAAAPQIDPEKEARAAREWNELGTKSLTDIAAEQGKDWERVNRQIKKERKVAAPPAPLPVQPVQQQAKPGNDNNPPKEGNQQ